MTLCALVDTDRHTGDVLKNLLRRASLNARLWLGGFITDHTFLSQAEQQKIAAANDRAEARERAQHRGRGTA